MANPNYSIEGLYNDIITINGYFSEDKKGQLTVNTKYGSIHDYCHYENNSGKCNNYFEMASSGVIHLLKKLKDTHKLEDDKLAEYAILWLSYKLNQHSNHKNKSANLNDFYTKYIETNNDYNKKINGDGSPTYKEIINKKKDLMNIKEIFHFDTPFSWLCYLYTMTKSEYWYCDFYLQHANSFADSFKLRYDKPNNKEGSSYRKLLSTISNDYGNLKKRCKKFPPLPELTPQKRPEENLAQNPVEIPVKNSGKDSGQILGHTSEATSSSSSILSTLIPGLSTFSVIPVFLGIAYKYSLFGIDKLFQRQYLRTKLKKVKKKMKLNI
ncbi:CIR protein PIR protein [Plasmodium vinckei brucechwatti]|uniref:CIR protein PIR protein n=1 Tax=Plasmodium vinckei brucechwatti TaxID=119398 RepID=A0A6V7RT05_PLAVN|nr:CIR protein PIR protein [Plasmodium vinckei brucechwatti]